MFSLLAGSAARTLVLSISLFGLLACDGSTDNGSTGITNSHPRVVSSSLDNAPIDATQNITFMFSENVIVNIDNLVLHFVGPNNQLTPIPVTTNYDDQTFMLSVTANLVSGSSYHFVLKSSISDLTGIALNERQYSFNTAGTAPAGTTQPGGPGTPQPGGTMPTGGGPGTPQPGGTMPTTGGGTGTTQPGGNTPPIAGNKTITFIELNDLHANLVPHWDQKHPVVGQNVTLAKRGGLARIAVKVKEIRALNLGNTILMNIGDTYHGGAEAMFSVGSDIVAPVDALGIDIAVPGNWDFAYGAIVSNARFAINAQPTNGVTRSTKIIYLGANTTFKSPIATELPTPPGGGGGGFPNIFVRMGKNLTKGAGATAGDPFMPATHVITKFKGAKSVKIGFIGLTSDIVKRMHPLMALNIAFTQGEAAYLALIEKYALQLRTQDKVDYVVVMSELGIHKDIALAELLNVDATQANKNVDIFFSAHTHELTETMYTSGSGVIVVESGNDTYLGQMDVSFDAANKVVNHKWQIHQIDNTLDKNTPEFNSMTALVATTQSRFIKLPNGPIDIPSILPPGLAGGGGGGGGFGNILTPQKFKNPLNKPLGKTSVPLERINSLESSFNNAYTDLLRKFTGKNLAITPGFRFDATIIPANDSNGNPSTFTSNFGNSYNWQHEPANAINPNDVRTSDVYRLMPAPYSIAVGEITSVKLKALIEQNLDEVYSTKAFDQTGGWVLGFSGLELVVDLTKPLGQRVVSMKVDVAGVLTTVNVADVTQRFTIAGCARPLEKSPNTTLCGYQGIFENVVKYTDAANNELPANDFFINQLQAGKVNALTTRKSITDNSKIKMWPDTAYVQPLKGVGTAGLVQ